MDVMSSMQQLDKRMCIVLSGKKAGLILPKFMLDEMGDNLEWSDYCVADGRAISTEKYADLYNVIGLTYRVSSTFGQFHIPDLSHYGAEHRTMTGVAG
jgi:hypothetical protein